MKNIFKQPINIVLIIIVAFILGYGISFIGENTFQAGWDAANQRLAETNFIPIMSEDIEITSVNGSIQEIENNKLTLKIQALEPLADSKLDIRIIEINDETIFYKLIVKSSEQFEKEFQEFEKTVEKEDFVGDIPYPEPFTKEEITFDDIKVGQRVFVEAGKDIKDLSQFEVVEVIIR